MLGKWLTTQLSFKISLCIRYRHQSHCPPSVCSMKSSKMVWSWRTWLCRACFKSLMQETGTHTFWHFHSRKSVATVVERRSSAGPNHNASFRLSGPLGTYSNKWWLTHRDTHPHWLIRKSWQEMLWSNTTQRHHSYSELSKLFGSHQNFSLREHCLKKKKSNEGPWRKIGKTCYRCTPPYCLLWYQKMPFSRPIYGMWQEKKYMIMTR